MSAHVLGSPHKSTSPHPCGKKPEYASISKGYRTACRDLDPLRYPKHRTFVYEVPRVGIVVRHVERAVVFLANDVFPGRLRVTAFGDNDVASSERTTKQIISTPFFTKPLFLAFNRVRSRESRKHRNVLASRTRHRWTVSTHPHFCSAMEECACRLTGSGTTCERCI